MQHLLGRAVWDADVVRDDVRDYLIAHLADPSTFLVVDETGDLNEGARRWGPAAVPRHLGQGRDGQIALFLTYAVRARAALVDRRLYLAQGRAADPARRHEAGALTRPGSRPNRTLPHR